MNPLDLEDPVVRLNVYLDLVTVTEYYLPGTVDCMLDLEATPVTSRNRRRIYSSFTPTTVQYKKGSRPFFERILDKILTEDMGEWERFATIGRWVTTREGWPPRSKRLPRGKFHGGTEEVIVKKGGGQCNETARLLTTALNVAGIPARQIGHWNACFRKRGKRVGHMTNEAHVNGNWIYIDATRGLMVPRGRGWASAWDLRNQPDLIRQCPDEFLRGYRNELSPAKMREFLLNNFDAETTLLTVTNYSIDERDRYNYDYFVPPKALRDHFGKERPKMFRRARRRVERDDE